MTNCFGCKARKDSVCLLGYRNKKVLVDNSMLLVPTGNCPRPTTKQDFHNELEKVDFDTREHFGLLA